MLFGITVFLASLLLISVFSFMEEIGIVQGIGREKQADSDWLKMEFKRREFFSLLLNLDFTLLST